MTQFDAPAPASEIKPDRVTPRTVIVAFWLWWPLLIVQAIVLILMVIAFAMSVIRLQTIPNSGPGEGFVMLIVIPVMMLVVTLLAVEISLLFRLRHGSNGARVWLMVMALLTALLAAGLIQVLQPSLQNASDGGGITTSTAIGIAVTTGVVIGATLALIGAVLPLLPPRQPLLQETSQRACDHTLRRAVRDRISASQGRTEPSTPRTFPRCRHNARDATAAAFSRIRG